MIFRFAFKYADDNREQFEKFKDARDFVNNFSVSQNLLNQFRIFSGKNGVQSNYSQVREAQDFIKTRLKAFIGRNFFDDQAFYPVLHKNDVEFRRAMDFLETQAS
jgi:carboxyl-terminal processing protease